MFTYHLILIGLLFFVVGVGVLGAWLRRHPSKENAEKTSRVIHFLFFAGMNAPLFIGVFYPGLTHFDEHLGLKSLPWSTFFLVVGIILAIPGLYLLVITNNLLRARGSGANAFRLTKRIVAEDVYQYTRNPMSLGFYLFSFAVGLCSGSTFITLIVLLGWMPAHLFFLKFFEELELELRFGESYLEYKKGVPFLIPNIAVSKKVEST
jgi:protein-S-isoprenylcysteine O-methyltransferase Ste14